ncbi:MAG: type I-C CRISPR-associated protein Cas8c/Csd1 [Prevotella ruminicola]|jgi:CRISPR-associated protein Csd1|uniref:Type I-C CRISPR-associated protein Cas8c/Csd1 n=1 Tax=Xylanibacter ruminicola TaxID=839 RepID=A0A9D5P3J9_XYLRU|nr:type I-C CRISPR-associated protein Cas8c/Csd1 [Xylanibacter ruminicola]
MILSALYDYYERCKETLPPFQRAYVKFKYAILIDEKGKYKGLEGLGDEEGITLLTYRPEERTSAPVPHCFGDNGSYVLGLKDIKPEKTVNLAIELKKNKKNYEAFVKDVETIYKALPHNKYAKAVYLFYQHYDQIVIDQMKDDVNWSGLCKSLNKNITFRIYGDRSVAATDEELIKYKLDNSINANVPMLCLVTGKKVKPVDTTYSTFILGSKSNAKLVSFQVSSGYDSYGKKMGLNAPISEDAEFKYTTSLLSMLSKKSRNKFMVGSRTFLFWASKNDEAGKEAEESVFSMFGFSEKDDDPNKNIEQVRKVFTAIYSGEMKTTSEDKFYILGLAPNSARIAVVYWAEIPLREFAGTICKHFEDMEVVDTRLEKKPYMSLRNILSTVTLGGKVSDATPNLPDAVVKSIFQGIPYPQTLFASCIRRIRAESGDKDKNAVHITRAAIIKAYLNRIDNNQKINVMLDKDNTNQGYLCGRLFAVLDKIQEEANNQHSIRERYMNSASSTPAAVFSTILNLSNHHVENLKNEGRKVFFEKLKQEIISKIDADGFKAQLDLQDQGRFFIGYYHQRQDFFSKNEDNNNE